MPRSVAAEQLAEITRRDISDSARGAKRLKIRTLLRKFGYVKRSDTNTAHITELLNQQGISINPPLVRLGDDWELGIEDWVYLSIASDSTDAAEHTIYTPPPDWNSDGWFDRVQQKSLRTEKEVELKFIVPLLSKLGYSEDDRYDGMPVPAAHGSRATTLEIDFALFNSSVEGLKNQPILTVEAKREQRLTKAKEIWNAHNQAKSYCLWTQCDFFMVTDSRSVQVFHVRKGGIDGPSPLLQSSRQALKERFGELYALVSRDVLTEHYLRKLATLEEIA